MPTLLLIISASFATAFSVSSGTARDGSFSSGDICSPDTVIELTTETGEIYFDASANVSATDLTCAWHIDPEIDCRAITFNTSISIFSWPDTLFFYTSISAMQQQIPVGRFAARDGVPPSLALTGSNEAVVVITATHRDTRLRINYECKSAGIQLLGSLRISPSWLTLWLGVWFLCLCACCFSTCWVVRQQTAGRFTR